MRQPPRFCLFDLLILYVRSVAPMNSSQNLLEGAFQRNWSLASRASTGASAPRTISGIMCKEMTVGCLRGSRLQQLPGWSL